MKPTYALLTFSLGVGCALAIVISCGDNMQSADAASECECPEAEKPLAGRINQVVDRRPAATPAMFLSASATCPGSALLLGGACDGVDSVNRNEAELVLYEFGPDEGNPKSFVCRWKNPLNLALEAVEARAVCLSPAL